MSETIWWNVIHQLDKLIPKLFLPFCCKDAYLFDGANLCDWWNVIHRLDKLIPKLFLPFCFKDACLFDGTSLCDWCKSRSLILPLVAVLLNAFWVFVKASFCCELLMSCTPQKVSKQWWNKNFSEGCQEPLLPVIPYSVQCFACHTEYSVFWFSDADVRKWGWELKYFFKWVSAFLILTNEYVSK